jgi:archaellum biogenesis ATPase FlaH
MSKSSIFFKNITFDKITLGDSVIDKFFQGGIPNRQITEVVGELASGKTQLLLQLALTVQWPKSHGGLSGSCIFIDTESCNWIKKAGKIAEAHLTKYGLGGHRALDNIFVYKHLGGPEDLYRLLIVIENIIKNQKKMPVHLLIIDSISAAFICSNHADYKSLKSSFYIKISRKLKYYAWYYNIAVVISKHKEPKFNGRISNSYLDKTIKHNRILSLNNKNVLTHGNLWESCLNNRILVTRKFLRNSNDPNQRVFKVILSGHIPFGQCNFKVDSSGISSVKQKL